MKALEVEYMEEGFIRDFLKGVRVVPRKSGAELREDASLAEEEESLHEDIRVEHFRLVADLKGEEYLPVVLASVVKSLVGVE
ncbi:hypothetical protein IEQ34_008251 [Dendrobium chrysotoxum]|uniref:Uncharacterized protein n=1 Tax=Dendrobium chrysotoxum TaxID=161865 RepID=A0AAV7H7K8_DENCH|nr:hypothetical protein IEQ34_008251 [Dendrobium chrysotoxum]